MSKALYIKGTNKLVAHISDAQLAQLVNLLQKETPTDRDYYIDQTIIGYLAEKGADKELVGVLAKALGATGNSDERFSSGSSTAQEGIEVAWREE
jgi:hypothetical protein